MAKTFYTDHDIEDMVKRGVQSLVLNDDVVLTERAYEKANRLGLKLVHSIDTPPSAPVRPYIAQPVAPKQTPAAAQSEVYTAASQAGLKQRIKEAVVTRLGNQVDATLLDTIIDRVLNTIEKK